MSGTAILFDLDGTLTDPYVGISRSIGFALERLGVLRSISDDLRWCIGPPLRSSFRLLMETEDAGRLDEALRLYRERYAEVGKFENLLIDGIPDTLAVLSGEGHRMWVATSKLKTYAVDIVDHFGLRPHFLEVHGSELDGRRSDKAELIAHIVEAEGLDPARTVMIGDRSHDVVGAKANAITTIGVSWGYAAPGELEQAGAVSIATGPEDLPIMIERAFRQV